MFCPVSCPPRQRSSPATHLPSFLDKLHFRAGLSLQDLPCIGNFCTIFRAEPTRGFGLQELGRGWTESDGCAAAGGGSEGIWNGREIPSTKLQLPEKVQVPSPGCPRLPCDEQYFRGYLKIFMVGRGLAASLNTRSKLHVHHAGRTRVACPLAREL